MGALFYSMNSGTHPNTVNLNSGDTHLIDRLSLFIYTPSMARMARVVAVDMPHHVAQRATGGSRLSFADEDYEAYRILLAESCRGAGVGIWAYPIHFSRTM